MNAPDQSTEDAAREARIEQLGAQMVLSSDLVERARLWCSMKDEIAHRSKAQIERMEKERGLTRSTVCRGFDE
ncbi:hypothetical protein [Paraburkholderia sp. C35]|uniref:hypothetical protein n=1 Tax=Paraburkholderia sp. C35 TaxID=2126993 RepID=UPI000D6942AC|nr:hypothetical protein [Paraburkholderia sp. C35]